MLLCLVLKLSFVPTSAHGDFFEEQDSFLLKEGAVSLLLEKLANFGLLMSKKVEFRNPGLGV